MSSMLRPAAAAPAGRARTDTIALIQALRTAAKEGVVDKELWADYQKRVSEMLPTFTAKELVSVVNSFAQSPGKVLDFSFFGTLGTA